MRNSVGPESLLFCATLVAFAALVPYTKVEESFNLQAIHDILTHGISRSALQHYDHLEFPGVVPRTFIGALVVSALSYVPLKILTLFSSSANPLNMDLTKQIIVRCSLALINAFALLHTRLVVTKTRGKIAGTFYLALQATQFHIMFYAGRTLPNMFAFPLTTIAGNMILDPSADLHPAIFLLTCSTVIFRAELILLLAPIVSWHLLITRRLSFSRTIKSGLLAGSFSLALSFTIDSYFWRYPVIPELSGFYFNAVQGNSKDWGTSPWYGYYLDIPKLLLNPLSTVLLIPVGVYHFPELIHVLAPIVGFISSYSIQPHKEWRFIVYVIPHLTALAASGASVIYRRSSKSSSRLLKWVTGMVLVGSIAVTGLLSLGMVFVSSMNYPGGAAMSVMPKGVGVGYLDVTTCMTGSTKFLQSHGTFNRTEDQEVLSSIDFWQGLRSASVADRQVIDGVYEASGVRNPWTLVNTVYGFDGVNVRGGWRSLGIRRAPKLFIMENVDHH